MAAKEPVDPASAALVIIECQKGVIGKDQPLLPALAEAAAPVLGTIDRLAKTARSAGVQVVHATFASTAGGRSADLGSPLFQSTLAHSEPWTAGSTPTQVVDEIAVEAEDVVSSRSHGLAPSQGTELLPVLRNLGVRTVVLAGVSLNIAIQAVAVDAANEGFRAVIPRDAVVGVPREYGEQVLRHSLAFVATLTSVDELAQQWT